MTSFEQMKQVPDSVLETRLEEVKKLPDPERKYEHYRIVKDKETGEHYLHYAYVHVDLAGSGKEEWFHHFMPIDTDGVLAIVLGEQEYTYPDHWQRPFLRNGPEGFYVWFDPGDKETIAHYETLGREIADVLMQYKQKGKFDEQTIRRMMEELDRLDICDRFPEG